MAYEQYRRWIILTFPDVGRGPGLDLVAGSFAGGTAVLFTYPLDLVRTKLAYQVTNWVVKNLTQVQEWVVLYTSGNLFLTNAICFFFLQVVGLPKLNVHGVANTQHIYKGIVDCFSMTYREAGLRGLYRGVGINLKTARVINCCPCVFLLLLSSL